MVDFPARATRMYLSIMPCHASVSAVPNTGDESTMNVAKLLADLGEEHGGGLGRERGVGALHGRPRGDEREAGGDADDVDGEVRLVLSGGEDVGETEVTADAEELVQRGVAERGVDEEHADASALGEREREVGRRDALPVALAG